MISPFAKKGVVQHEVRDTRRSPACCERVFSLPTMTERDAQADDLMDALDLEQAPRPVLRLQGLGRPIVAGLSDGVRILSGDAA